MNGNTLNAQTQGQINRATQANESIENERRLETIFDNFVSEWLRAGNSFEHTAKYSGRFLEICTRFEK